MTFGTANYDAVAKENTELAQQLEVQQKKIEELLADKARLVSEKKRIQESLVGGERSLCDCSIVC